LATIKILTDQFHPFLMKDLFRSLFQKLFGFKNYLFCFSLYCIKKVNNGTYEQEFMHFVRSIAKQGIILDIGANIGITAAPLAKHLPQAQIHAFEPIAENFSTLSKIISFLKLKNVSLFNFALGNEDGRLKMIMPTVNNSRMQGLSKAYDLNSDEQGVIYEVPIKRLDDLYSEKDHVVAIKIDVENFEYEVLKGAKNLLLRNMPMIYCELWDNENRKLALDLLYAIGYRSFVYDAALNELVPWVNTQSFEASNFFFLADDKNLVSAYELNPN
jgi:FkbM family methyltransferase